MIKILHFESSRKPSAMDWYRSTVPLAMLEREYDDIRIITHPAGVPFSWRTFAGADVVFMARGIDQNAFAIAEMCYKMRVPLVLDYDDDLFNVHEVSPAYEHFNANKEQAKEIISLADVVTVSTKGIVDSFKEHGIENTVVIPNAHNDYIFPMHKAEQHNPDGVIAWRGSSMHGWDFQPYKDVIIELIKSYPEKQWKFFGELPDFLKYERLKNVTATGEMPLMDYFHAFYSERQSVVFVPLDGHKFNLSKSNIAMLEAIYAGALVVAPDMPEWNLEGCHAKYEHGNSDSFYDAIAPLIRRTENNIPYADPKFSTQVWMRNERILSVINPMRYQLFKGLVEQSRATLTQEVSE